MLHYSSHRPSLCSTCTQSSQSTHIYLVPLRSDYTGLEQPLHPAPPPTCRSPSPVTSHSPAVTLATKLQALTYAEELRVHAVKVGHKEEANGSRGIKEEQESGQEVKEKPTPVYHQQACQLLGQHQPADTGTKGQGQSAGSPSRQSTSINQA